MHLQHVMVDVHPVDITEAEKRQRPAPIPDVSMGSRNFHWGCPTRCTFSLELIPVLLGVQKDPLNP